MTSPVEKLRAHIAEADRCEKISRAAELARVKIRLGEEPVVRRGLLGFLRRPQEVGELFFDAAETKAIYVALGLVRDDHARLAAAAEAKAVGGES